VPQAATQTLSERYWGIDWAAELPRTFGDVRVQWASFDDVSGFLQAHGLEMFGVDAQGRWLHESMTPAKRQFLRDSDVFTYWQDGALAGYLMAQPTDWSTYYVRSMALLPSCRGQGVVGAMNELLVSVLRPAGVQRLEADTSGANAAMATALLRLGWVATGITNTDRWGSMVRYTNYLGQEATEVFRHQYCFDARPRRRTHP
jgi:hypothetical protein